MRCSLPPPPSGMDVCWAFLRRRQSVSNSTAFVRVYLFSSHRFPSRSPRTMGAGWPGGRRISDLLTVSGRCFFSSLLVMGKLLYGTSGRRRRRLTAAARSTGNANVVNIGYGDTVGSIDFVVQHCLRLPTQSVTISSDTLSYGHCVQLYCQRPRLRVAKIELPPR